MKRAALIGGLVASLATGSAAFARDGDRDWDRDHDRGRSHQYDRHYDRRDYDRRDYDRRDYDRRYYDRRDYDHRTRYGAYYRPPGYYEHRWVRGERLPRFYYGSSYVITDYRGYGLRAPPRGCHWVRVNGDAVLAAVATGIVLDTVFHAFD